MPDRSPYPMRLDQFQVSLAGIDTLRLVSGIGAPDKRIQQHRNVIEAARIAGEGR